ncbi:MAG: hypothetical protein GTO45_16370 [Candidatus Aminicenantes bacterium]|nr:hypothetical protein [Candidatus Aminicenantes bacterium]NIM78276.1 hypothetical protein [Candidatus Aminicenantes bacterium]NIN19702.1 hypothetical protein [Candidatus Aminicenantes bacterium]NIN43584.1 hypothetical protein [Candidatus Aminicenantes bacterium]NIN86329.1 hypothetical protein [Candidatus Aminicenantes bacterium]
MRRTLIPISIILTLLIFCGYQYGYIAANYSCKVYPNQCDGEGSGDDRTSPTVGQLIIEAASFLLQSNSDYQLFLKNYENSADCGIDFAVFREIIDNAVENMERASLKYFQTWEISKCFDYDPLVLEKLRQFDYEKFQKENNLNPAIFQEVSNFLKTGNVNSIYEKAYNATDGILRELRVIKASIDSGSIPAIKDCWRINQKYLELELFLMYVSQVFFEI